MWFVIFDIWEFNFLNESNEIKFFGDVISGFNFCVFDFFLIVMIYVLILFLWSGFIILLRGFLLFVCFLLVRNIINLDDLVFVLFRICVDFFRVLLIFFFLLMYVVLLINLLKLERFLRLMKWEFSDFKLL